MGEPVPKNPEQQSGQQCQVLGNLFEGPSGQVSVGRMMRGKELGRLVFLRHVAARHDKLVPFVDTARCVAHPSLMKVLGVVEGEDMSYIASEYVCGVSLLELRNAATSSGRRIDTPVGVRIVRDALLAAARARMMFSETVGITLKRAIFPDTVWIAQFGETLLTEAGLGAALNVPGNPWEVANPPSEFEDEIHDDVGAAGAELLQLLTNQPLEDSEMTVPLAGNLASIVARAVNPAAPNRFANANEMAKALSALPRHLIADDEDVAHQVKKLTGSVLVLRHAKRLMSVPAPTGGDDAETCIYHGPDSFSAGSPPISEPIRARHGSSPDSSVDQDALQHRTDPVPAGRRPDVAPASRHDEEVTVSTASAAIPIKSLDARFPISSPGSQASISTSGAEVPLSQPHGADDVTERMTPSQSGQNGQTREAGLPPPSEEDPTWVGTPFHSVLPGGRATPLRVAILSVLFALGLIAVLELWVL